MDEKYEKKFRALKRQRPLWERVVLQTPPVRLLRCLLIRAFFDHWYKKTELTTDEWEAQRSCRSYERMLDSLGARDILGQPIELSLEGTEQTKLLQVQAPAEDHGPGRPPRPH